jgi:UDP-glucose 4-epimerase
LAIKNKTYLVTGGSGFIGLRLCNAIQGAGSNLHLILRKKIEGIECKQFICDLGSGDIDKEAFKGVDVIFHLVGYAHDLRGNSNLNIYQHINVDLTIKLAELAIENNVKNIVFISSVKAGGNKSFLRCMSEADQEEPIGYYGKTKRAAELELLRIGRKNKIRISIIRPSLVYGPGVKGNLQLMLSSIKRGLLPPLPETGNKKSMIHVDDLVEAILLVAHSDNADGEIFIATDGKKYSSREIYEGICTVIGKPIPKWSLPRFVFDLVSLASPKIKYKVDKLLGDECYSSKKLESIGFKPSRSFEDMNETCF